MRVYIVVHTNHLTYSQHKLYFKQTFYKYTHIEVTATTFNRDTCLNKISHYKLVADIILNGIKQKLTTKYTLVMFAFLMFVFTGSKRHSK